MCSHVADLISRYPPTIPILDAVPGNQPGVERHKQVESSQRKRQLLCVVAVKERALRPDLGYSLLIAGRLLDLAKKAAALLSGIKVRHRRKDKNGTGDVDVAAG